MFNEKVKGVISDIEGHFEPVIEAFPRILEKTDQIKNCDDMCSTTTMTGVLDSAASDLGRMRNEMEKLFYFLKENLEKIKDYTAQISEIRDQVLDIKSLSEELKIYSLNSMVVAIKAGKSGGGFSYITQELRILADDTISESDDLARSAEMVSSNFSEIQDIFQESDSVTSEFIAKFDKKMNSLVTGLNHVMAEVKDLFQREKTGFDAINNLVLSAMEAVQSQDLIKQSLEQITVSYDKLAAYKEKDMDHRDFLVINRDLLKTSLIIIDDVKTLLADCSLALKEKTDNISEELSSIGDIQRELTDKLYGTHETLNPETINEMYHSNFRNFKIMMDKINLKTSQIRNQFQEILKSLALYPAKVDRLGNINVAARIEISKYKALEIILGTVEDMINLQEVIDRDVKNSIDGSKNLSTSLEYISAQIRGFNEREKEMKISFIETIAENFKAIDSIIDQSMSSSEMIRDNTEGLNQDFSMVFDNLTSLDDVERKLEDLHNLMTQERRELEDELSGILAEEGLTDWTLQNDTLRQIIDKFTIYNHKAAAAELSNIDIDDEILDQGEVALF